MSYPAWPATLPQKMLVDGYSGALSSNVLRTDMEAGPKKMRRLTTANVEPVKGMVKLTQAQWITLRTFFYTTLAEVLPFTWVHPTTGAAVNYRFVSPPAESDPGPATVNILLDLETVP